jgi:hypothetical protein
MEKGGVLGDDACGHHWYDPSIPQSVWIFYLMQKIITFWKILTEQSSLVIVDKGIPRLPIPMPILIKE